MTGEARPPDERDAAREIGRDLANLASQLSSVKGEAINWLTAPEYEPLLHRLEDARQRGGRCDGGEAQGAAKRGT